MPNSYFAKKDGALVTSAKLQEAKVDFSEFTLKTASGAMDGFLLANDSILDKMLKDLELEIAESAVTQYKGILFIKLREKKNSGAGKNPEDEVTADSPPEKLKIIMPANPCLKTFKQITRELLSPIFEEGAIEILLPGGKTINCQKLGEANFYILIHSASRYSASRQTPPAKLWGIEVDNHDQTSYSSGEGVSILDPDAPGYEVAELIDRRFFYIHHNVCSRGTKNEADLYRKIIEAAVWELTFPENDKRQFAFASVKPTFVKACNYQQKDEVGKLEESVKQEGDAITALQQQYFLALRTYEEKRLRLAAIKTNEISYYEKKFLTQFDDIAKMQKVRSVSIDRERKKLIIFTDFLFCKHPKKNQIHEIGRFKIEIDISGNKQIINRDNEFGIRWHNLTRKVDGYDPGMNAPDVYPRGVPCLGTAAQYLPELLANYEYSAIVDLAIQFVESVNLDDGAGCYLENWPIVKKIEKNAKKDE